jgi:hypothetical protein
MENRVFSADTQGPLALRQPSHMTGAPGHRTALSSCVDFQNPMTSAQTLRVRVAQRQASGIDIALFTLVSADGTPLPAFEAGAHIDVHLKGADGQEIIRQY